MSRVGWADVQHCVGAVLHAVAKGNDNIPLLPRMNASPYLFLSWPLTYSCVGPTPCCDCDGTPHPYLCLLHSNVHVAIQARQYP